MNTRDVLKVMSHGTIKQINEVLQEMDPYASAYRNLSVSLRSVARVLVDRHKDNRGSARRALLAATRDMMLDELLDVVCEFVEENLSVDELEEFAREFTNRKVRHG
jgi:hypothetical protein